MAFSLLLGYLERPGQSVPEEAGHVPAGTSRRRPARDTSGDAAPGYGRGRYFCCQTIAKLIGSPR